MYRKTDNLYTLIFLCIIFSVFYMPPLFFSPFRNLRKAAYEKAHTPLDPTAIFPNKPLRPTNQ